MGRESNMSRVYGMSFPKEDRGWGNFYKGVAVGLVFSGLAFCGALNGNDIKAKAEKAGVVRSSDGIYKPWGKLPLTAEQSANKWRVISQCAMDLGREDPADLRDNISKKYKEDNGKELDWGNTEAGFELPLPQACVDRYKK